jgi:hypothetical protein
MTTDTELSNFVKAVREMADALNSEYVGENGWISSTALTVRGCSDKLLARILNNEPL